MKAKPTPMVVRHTGRWKLGSGAVLMGFGPRRMSRDIQLTAAMAASTPQEPSEICQPGRPMFSAQSIMGTATMGAAASMI
nr:hypothetical protein CE91St29_08830 [Corynebacterium striatum]